MWVRLEEWWYGWSSCIWPRYLQHVPGAMPLMEGSSCLLCQTYAGSHGGIPEGIYIYSSLQEWDHRQGVFLNCFSHDQLLLRNSNKWQGLSYTLAVIPGSVGVGASHLCAVCLDGSCGSYRATVTEIMQRHEIALMSALMAWNWDYVCPEMWFMRYLQALLQ